MNGFDLLKAMGNINEGLIEETYRHKRVSRSGKWRVIMSFAASVACILLLLAIIVLPERWNSSQQSGNRDETAIYDRVNGTISMDVIRELDVIFADLSEDGATQEMEEEGNAVLEENYVPHIYPTREVTAGYYYVLDEDGNISFTYQHYTQYNEWKKEWTCMPMLVHSLTGNVYWFGSNMNQVSLEEFLKEAELLADEIEQNAKQTQAESESDVVKREEFEEQLRSLWDRKEELGILDIKYSADMDKISIVTKLTEEKVYAKLTEEEREKIEIDKYPYASEILDLNVAKGIDNLDEFMKFIADADGHWIDSENEREQRAYEQYAGKLRTALERLKGEYPDYTYLQLYYHVAYDLEYECYLNFSEELNGFVESLDNYEPETYFIEELAYGDASRIELKRMLRQYKQLYPDLSYEEIYEKCGYKEFLENDPLAGHEEQLAWALYQKYQFAEEQTDIRRNRGIAVALIGLALLAVVSYKERKKQKERMRELCALSAALLWYVGLPVVLGLSAGPADMLGVVMIPNVYFAPVFLIVAMLLYRMKGGRYLRFMLYTLAAVFMEVIVVMTFASIWMLVGWMLICEGLVLLLGDKIIAKLKDWFDIAEDEEIKNT